MIGTNDVPKTEKNLSIDSFPPANLNKPYGNSQIRVGRITNSVNDLISPCDQVLSVPSNMLKLSGIQSSSHLVTFPFGKEFVYHEP